jgi:hypothetical protein
MFQVIKFLSSYFLQKQLVFQQLYRMQQACGKAEFDTFLHFSDTNKIFLPGKVLALLAHLLSDHSPARMCKPQ